MPWWAEITGALLHNGLRRCRIRARYFRMNQKKDDPNSLSCLTNYSMKVMLTNNRRLTMPTTTTSATVAFEIFVPFVVACVFAHCSA